MIYLAFHFYDSLNENFSSKASILILYIQSDWSNTNFFLFLFLFCGFPRKNWLHEWRWRWWSIHIPWRDQILLSRHFVNVHTPIVLNVGNHIIICHSRSLLLIHLYFSHSYANSSSLSSSTLMSIFYCHWFGDSLLISSSLYSW